MAAGADGEETFDEGYGKASELAVQATKEQEAKVDGTEHRVPDGAYRSTSTAAKVTKERIVLERDCGPRPEARKEGKGQEKGGKGDARVCWSCGKTGHTAANWAKGNWTRSSESSLKDQILGSLNQKKKHQD